MPQSQTLSRPKIFRDPIHDVVVLDRGRLGGVLKHLIDSPEFQRLRRIRQLGLSCFVFPGAEHSRFTHSLGTYCIAKRILEALESRTANSATARTLYNRELGRIKKEILVAALLHDVGHGPFSHLFETALRGTTAKGNPRDHEEWSQKIIKERFTGVLKANKVKSDVVIALLDKKQRTHLLAKDIISSQLDADRMDYLLRDSHATGAQYGQFDLEWLLRALRIGTVKVRGQTRSQPRLCFHEAKGRDIVTGFIIARETMYLTVYIHKTTRAYEALFLNIVKLAQHLFKKKRSVLHSHCPPAMESMLQGGKLSVADYLSLDDFKVWSVLAEWSKLRPGDALHKLLVRKCDALVNRRRPYRMIEIDKKTDDARDKAAITFIAQLAAPLSFSCHYDMFSDLAYRNVFYRKSSDEEEQEDRAISFVNDKGKTRVAEASSDVIRAISEVKTSVCRLYYDESQKALVKKLRSVGLLR